MLYADSNKLEPVDEFIKKKFTAMMESVRPSAIKDCKGQKYPVAKYNLIMPIIRPAIPSCYEAIFGAFLL